MEIQRFELGGRQFLCIKVGSWKLILRPGIALSRARHR